MYMPALLNKYPGYAGISGRQPGYAKYAGLADALIFRPGPFLDNPA
jgi:hypothetical protein